MKSANSQTMVVCYFGTYNPHYPRNHILMTGLRENGVRVVECTSIKQGIYKYFDLARKLFKLKKTCDAIVVGFPGYQAVLLARLLTRKPLIFDCFTSVYDSMVHDRKQVSVWSARALYYWLLDWVSMHAADIVLFDTHAHCAYARQTFGIPMSKMRRIWVGANADIFFPRSRGESREIFTVLFFGTYIPLQGIEYIIDAARELRDEPIRFVIMGDGQERESIRIHAEKFRVENVLFMQKIPQEKLPEEIARADICLGIFGNTNKTKRVIPNKVYECLAMRKPVITADTSAARELLGSEDVLFVPVADGISLAGGILRLKNDSKKMDMLARSGYNRYIKNATPVILGRELKELLHTVIANEKQV